MNNQNIMNKKKFSGSLNLILGPMYSGKTSMLISRYDRHIIAGRKCIMIKYINDTRYDDKKVVTHNGIKVEAILCDELANIDKKVKNYDVVCIDEIQFYKDAYIFCDKWANMGIIIEVAGLNGTFERKPFDIISRLIPLANSIENITAICRETGKNANYSKRKTDDKQVELIGGIDTYCAADRLTFFGATDDWYIDNFMEYMRLYCNKRKIEITEKVLNSIKQFTIDKNTNYKKLIKTITSNNLKYANLNDKIVILRSNMNNEEDIWKARDSIHFIMEKCKKLIILTNITLFNRNYLEGSLLSIEIEYWDSINNDIPSGSLVLLSSIEDSDQFYKKISNMGDVFVNDDFSSCHINNKDNIGNFTNERYMGFEFYKEYKYLHKIFDKPGRKLAIIGSSNNINNLNILVNLIDKVNTIIIAGSLAITFLKYLQSNNSYNYNSKGYQHIHNILEKAKNNKVNIYLPNDIICNNKIISEINDNLPNIDENLCDIGPNSLEYFNATITDADIIIWCGLLGEISNENNSTKYLLENIANTNSIKILVGKKLTKYCRNLGLNNKYDHCSSTDDASYELLSGNKISSIEMLK